MIRLVIRYVIGLGNVALLLIFKVGWWMLAALVVILKGGDAALLADVISTECHWFELFSSIMINLLVLLRPWSVEAAKRFGVDAVGSGVELLGKAYVGLRFCCLSHLRNLWPFDFINGLIDAFWVSAKLIHYKHQNSTYYCGKEYLEYYKKGLKPGIKRTPIVQLLNRPDDINVAILKSLYHKEAAGSSDVLGNGSNQHPKGKKYNQYLSPTSLSECCLLFIVYQFYELIHSTDEKRNHIDIYQK